jgi:dihydroorotate dehydrogenase (NAD+) catalytic subunit
VWEVAKQVRIPIIGCGGVSNVRDTIEFFMAGATAVQVGTATFSNPAAMIDIISSLPAEVAALGASSVDELIGTVVPGG